MDAANHTTCWIHSLFIITTKNSKFAQESLYFISEYLEDDIEFVYEVHNELQLRYETKQFQPKLNSSITPTDVQHKT